MVEDPRAVSREHHPIFARLYAWMSPGAEAKGVGDHRRELLAGLSGRVVEPGAGNGLNFAHYPGTVEEVVALEPEPYLRRLAERAAGRGPVRVTVMDGLAGRLPLPDGSFDAGVASLVLCSVPDQDRALAELWRVIRPGGELRFYEHVGAGTGALSVMQRVVDPVWTRLAGGCHVTRDPLGAIERAGFALEDVRRFTFRLSPIDLPASPHVLGRARRP